MASTSDVCRKRGSQSLSFEGRCASPPRKITYFYVLESESDVLSEATESIHSIQDMSTDIARDTSDISTNSELSDSEYEVRSLNGDEHLNPFDQCDTLSSGTDTNIRAISIPALCEQEDDLEELWADSSSESDPEQDPELSLADFWECAQCKNSNNNPLFRYCEKCFKIRKEFFPPRPRGKKKRKPRLKRKSRSRFNTADRITDFLSQPSTSSEQVITFSSGSTISQMKYEEENVQSSSSTSLNQTICKAQSSTDLAKGEQKNPDSCQEPLCSTCLLNSKNGIFVHGSWAHIYSCYKCSLKIWKETGRCPICNSKVSQVLKAVVAY